MRLSEETPSFLSVRTTGIIDFMYDVAHGNQLHPVFSMSSLRAPAMFNVTTRRERRTFHSYPTMMQQHRTKERALLFSLIED